MLKTAGMVAAGAGLAVSASASSSRIQDRVRPAASMSEAFEYRLLLGWINDNSNRPLSGGRWPITTVDEQTVREYKSSCERHTIAATTASPCGVCMRATPGPFR